MPNAGYFGLTYELLFEGDGAWTDITALVDSRTTKIDVAGCSEDLKSVISKCTFEMRYNSTPSKTVHSELVGKILSAKQAGQRVLFRMGGIASFVGKVDLGSFSQRNGRIPGFLTVTVEDNSYLLDEVMATSFEYPTTEDLDDEGYAVFDKTNLAQSIAMLRFLDAGYTLDQIDLTTSDSITEKVRRVVYDADDERTYREMLDTLLFEHCAVIYTTPEGKLSVRRLYRESPVSERSVDEFLVGDGIETGGGDYSYDGVKVVWSNLSKLDGAVVYNANITMKLDDKGNREGEEIQPQHYWPEDGDIEETWQEFNATFLDRAYQTKVSRLKNKDLSLISVKNAYYEVDKDAEILLANNPPEIEPTKARVLWWNSHSTDVKKLYGFTIVGDALFRSKLNESTYPTDARKLDEPYETEFVYTSEAAAKLANHLHRFRKYGDLHHRWSEIGVDTPLFQVVTVSAPDTLISSLGMVISQSISFPAPNKIKRSNSAIGITAFNSEPVKTRSIQLGGAPVNTGPAGSNGTRSVVQFILGTADGPYTDAGNVVGTDSAILGTDLALVGVEGAQWEYEAPTPDAGEIVWRREGYYTPPETWPKVWNTTPMTGASSFGITLHPSALTIPVSSRGVPYGGNISISAVFQNIPTTYEIVWGITGASFVDAGTNQTKVVEVDTVTSDAVIITVSVLFGGVTYTDMVTLNKVADGKPAPVNLGGVTVVPTDVGGEPLVAGDYFLWAGTTTATYTKGEIYEWDGDSWEKSTNRNLVMTMFDDFADLANDVDETVIGLAVIKKLVAIDAFIETLQSQLIEITTGGAIYSGYSADGLTPPASGSGFWLGANGKLKSYFAELLGTLRTGLNAPTDARVAIQDESGITSGPTFTGSGLNDLNIIKEGNVAGNFRVKISGINNATNSGKEGYWATLFQVGTAMWRSVAVNSSGRFVAVGVNVSYSDDGITWATLFQVGVQAWFGVAVNSAGRFVAVGGYGNISYSDDGITWVTPFLVGTRFWYDVAVNSAGRFVAVGSGGYVSYSDDGITWATPFQVLTIDWEGVAVNSTGRFVVVGAGGNISYSNDGITWATPFRPFASTCTGVAVNSAGRFVAVGYSGYVSYSNDGITWATPFQVGTPIWQGVAVNSAGRFVAVGRYGYMSYSDDGITWVTPFLVGPNDSSHVWMGVAVNSAGRFVAVGNIGYITMSLLQDTIQISSNGGTTWGSDIPIPSGEAISITGFGIDILFSHFRGHTVGNYWSFTQGAMRGLVITDSDGDEYFSASNGVINVKETLLLSGIPTSATGLSSGSVWRDGTTLKIV